MLKLYRRDNGHTHYWEAWDARDGTVMVHSGVLGETGETRTVAIDDGDSADDVIERESEEPRFEGYEELDPDDHVELIVQHNTADAWGDGADLDKRHSVEGILNECLGWTGNGHCDGGDIGSGTTNA